MKLCHWVSGSWCFEGTWCCQYQLQNIRICLHTDAVAYTEESNAQGWVCFFHFLLFCLCCLWLIEEPDTVLVLCLVALSSCLGFCDWWNSHERKLTRAVCLVLNNMSGQYVVWSHSSWTYRQLALPLLAQSSSTKCRRSRVLSHFLLGSKAVSDAIVE